MRRAFGAEFDVPAGYLNTPSIGIPSSEVADTVSAAVRRWARGGDRPPDFDAAVAESRAGFAHLVGVPADRVAIGTSVAQLVSMVAAQLPNGARVAAARGEFTSVTFPFLAQADRGVAVTELDLAALPTAVADFDLVAVSVVQSADGSIVALEQLRQAARSAGVPVLLDVTQAAGWRPLHLDWADWVVGAGYKWLLCPRGAAWMAVHPDALARTRAHLANWYAGDDPWQTVYGLPVRLAAGARGFDLSPVWLAHVAAATALPYLASLDLDQVRQHCVGLTDSVLTRLGLPAHPSAIASLPVDGAAQRLAETGVTASTRAGQARIGFHLYNTEQDADLVVRALG